MIPFMATHGGVGDTLPREAANVDQRRVLLKRASQKEGTTQETRSRDEDEDEDEDGDVVRDHLLGGGGATVMGRDEADAPLISHRGLMMGHAAHDEAVVFKKSMPRKLRWTTITTTTTNMIRTMRCC